MAIWIVIERHFLFVGYKKRIYIAYGSDFVTIPSSKLEIGASSFKQEFIINDDNTMRSDNLCVWHSGGSNHATLQSKYIELLFIN